MSASMSAYRTLVPTTPELFVAPEKSDFFFIIWNLFLTDKLTPLTEENLSRSNIVEIIAFLPSEQEYEPRFKDVPLTVFAYGEHHTPLLPLEQYDVISKRIDEIAKRPRDQRRNVLLFCNNGYQRSLPFLVYYLTNYHQDEFPTIEKAVAYLHQAIRNQSSFEEKKQILAQIQQLFQTSI